MGMRHNHNISGVIFNIVHEKKSLKFIKKIIGYYNPEIIIELGTGHGGMTYLFHKTLPDSIVYSFNIDQRHLQNEKVFGENVIFYSEDLLKKPNETVINILKQNGTKFLYCDNGDKIKEVKYYSKYLNIGDILGVHDWNKEIFYDDVKDELSGFFPIKHDQFESLGFSSRFWIKDI